MSTKQQPYNDYGSVMRRRLGGRMQKLAIDAHLGCPNRDGTVAVGGCTFCLCEAFSPSYCRATNSITQQIDSALAFHNARGRKADNYIAYFQSGSNTHASADRLKKLYDEALSHPAISGIIIGTRPDCISSEKLDILEHISQTKYVAVEYGIESTYDKTLSSVNRGHNYATAQRAVQLTRERNIDVGAHFILGLPGEKRNDIIDGISTINSLGINFIKFHQLQIYRSTPLANEWEEHPERFMFSDSYSTDEYVELIVDIIRRLNPAIAIERFASMAPPHLIAHSPLRGLRPDALRDRIIARLNELCAYQGDLCAK